jgi:hypothetical protein
MAPPANVSTTLAPALGATQAVATFLALVPSMADVRKASKDDVAFVADLRMGEFGASAITVGVGIIGLWLTRDPSFLIIAVFACLGLTLLYEWTLAGPRFVPKGDY